MIEQQAAGVSLTETIFTHPNGFGINATPCQRAWCRVLDGTELGTLWDWPAVRRMFGGIKPLSRKPEQFVGTTAPRTGKSLILASYIIGRALFCDLSQIKDSENGPLIPVVSVRKRNARAILGHITRLTGKPGWVQARCGQSTRDKVVLRHSYTGTPIPIEVIAGSAAGSNLESFWLVDAVFDEVFKLKGEDEAVVNLDDARIAVLGRILPGGIVAYVGSPWMAAGPAFVLLDDFWGEAASLECVVARSTGPDMNPAHWTVARMSKLQHSKDQRARDAFTLASGEFISKTAGLLGEAEIDAVCNRSGTTPPEVGRKYVACIDPATRRNAWTLMVAHREVTGMVVDVAAQWVPTPGNRLIARRVMGEVRNLIRPYGLDRVFSDRWNSDTLAELAEDHSLRLLEHRYRGPEGQHALNRVVDAVLAGAYSLPNDSYIKKDLRGIRRKVTASGPLLVLVLSPDGRHADYVSTLALCDELLPGVRFGGTLHEVFPSNFLDDEYVSPPAENPEEQIGSMKRAQAVFPLAGWPDFV